MYQNFPDVALGSERKPTLALLRREGGRRQGVGIARSQRQDQLLDGHLLEMALAFIGEGAAE